MGDADGALEINNPGSALDRVGGPHKSFERGGGVRAALEFEQPGGERGGLSLGLDAEEFQHRELAQIVLLAVIHDRLRLRAENNKSPFRKPTTLLPHDRRPWV